MLAQQRASLYVRPVLENYVCQTRDCRSDNEVPVLNASAQASSNSEGLME